MPKNRRVFLKKTAVFTASALISSQSVCSQWMTENPQSNLLDNIIPKLSAIDSTIIDTDKIEIKLPKIAGKGIAVPITVSSSLENIQSISIWVEKNPMPLVAMFRLSTQLDAFVSARLKILETSDIIVIVETADKLYRAKEQIRVIIDGCGY